MSHNITTVLELTVTVGNRDIILFSQTIFSIFGKVKTKGVSESLHNIIYNYYPPTKSE